MAHHVVAHYGEHGLILVLLLMQVKGLHILIALRDGAIQDAGFYSSFHQISLEAEGHVYEKRENILTDNPYFSVIIAMCFMLMVTVIIIIVHFHLH